MPHASSSSSSSSGRGAGAGAGAGAAEAGPSARPHGSYAFYLGSAAGLISSVRLAPPLDAEAAAAAHQALPQPVEMLAYPAAAGRKDTAVQRMAAAHVGKRWVLAVARKNGCIDLMTRVAHDDTAASASAAAAGEAAQAEAAASDAMAVSQDAASTSSAVAAEAPLPPPRERLRFLACVAEPRMRVGMERWLALALSDSGLYSLTSAGALRFTPLLFVDDDTLSLGASVALELPAPLQTGVFHPPASPTHLLIGGDDVSPSLWQLSLLLSPPASSSALDDDDDDNDEASAEPSGAGVAADDEARSAKARKRKRQAESRKKARELLPGEIWRAKALPNDALSLPQAPRITSACILGASSSSSSSSPPTFTLAAGTRDGVLRLVVAGAPSSEGRQECFVADGSGKLYATDEEGAVTYSYKDITGAVNVVLPLCAPLSSSSALPISAPLLLSASLDRLLRLHSTAPGAAQRAGASKQRGTTLASVFAGQTALGAVLWDGECPVVDVEMEGEEEEVWEAMDRVGEEEEEESEEEEEERSKKTKKH